MRDAVVNLADFGLSETKPLPPASSEECGHPANTGHPGGTAVHGADEVHTPTAPVWWVVSGEETGERDHAQRQL